MSLTENKPNQLEKLIIANQMRFEKNLEGALVIYQELASLENKNVGIDVVIAMIYFQLAMSNSEETGENYIQAIGWLQRAIAQQPNNAGLHVALAEIYALGMVEYGKAADEYREALQHNPYLISALVGASALYGTPEKIVTLHEAIDWMERAIKLQPDDANYHARLSDLYLEAGRELNARNERQIALLCPKPLDPRSVRLS